MYGERSAAGAAAGVEQAAGVTVKKLAAGLAAAGV